MSSVGRRMDRSVFVPTLFRFHQKQSSARRRGPPSLSLPHSSARNLTVPNQWCIMDRLVDKLFHQKPTQDLPVRTPISVTDSHPYEYGTYLYGWTISDCVGCALSRFVECNTKIEEVCHATTHLHPSRPSCCDPLLLTPGLPHTILGDTHHL